MVFAVEPLVWVPGVRGGGGVRIEDMILITEGEAQVLSRVEYEERLAGLRVTSTWPPSGLSVRGRRRDPAFSPGSAVLRGPLVYLVGAATVLIFGFNWPIMARATR